MCTTFSTELCTSVLDVEYNSSEINHIYGALHSLCEVSNVIKSMIEYDNSTGMWDIRISIPDDLLGIEYLYVPEYDWHVVPDMYKKL